MRRFKPGVPGERGERNLAVAPLVPKHGVKGSKVPLPLGYKDNGSPSGRQHAPDVQQRPAVILQMLDHIQADDGVVSLIQLGERGNVCNVAVTRLHIRPVV